MRHFRERRSQGSLSFAHHFHSREAACGSSWNHSVAATTEPIARTTTLPVLNQAELLELVIAHYYTLCYIIGRMYV